MTVNTHLIERVSDLPIIKPGWSNFRRWATGSRGREAMVTPLGSRVRVADKDEGTRKPEGDGRVRQRVVPTRGALEGQQASGSGHRAIRNPAIANGKSNHGGDR